MSESDEPKKLVITHCDTFHADEVTAVAILRWLLDGNIEVVRTRDMDIIETGDIVVDVGKKYDPETFRFDHHQEECNETWTYHKPDSRYDPIEITETRPDGEVVVKKITRELIPLSSAGMVFQHYGKDFLAKYLSQGPESWHQKEGVNVPELMDYLYNHIFLELDANDNGISLIAPGQGNAPIQNYRYNMTYIGLIRQLNGANVYDHNTQMKCFMMAVNAAWMMLTIAFDGYINDYFEFSNAIEIVTPAMKTRHEIHPTGEILVFEKSCKNACKALNVCEKEMLGENEPNIKFTIYPRGTDQWSVGTVGTGRKMFENRMDLLSEEVMLEKLAELNPDYPSQLVFIHKKLFTGSAMSREVAISMARISLVEQSQTNENDNESVVKSDAIDVHIEVTSASPEPIVEKSDS